MEAYRWVLPRSACEQSYLSGWNDSHLVGLGDPYAQTIQALKNIEQAIHKAGASLERVVRTRIFVTHVKHWEAVGRAHGEFFRDIRPASTLVAVSRLIHPDMLVEIEADAVVTS